MKLVLCFLLAISCQLEGDLAMTVTDMKNHLLMDDEYVFRRYLNTEMETCMAYGQVIQDLKNITQDLWGLLSSARTQMSMITGMSKGTPAEGCVHGLSNYLSDLVTKENIQYEECLLPVSSSHKKLLASLSKDVALYKEYKERALTGIDHCLSLFPSKLKESERLSCTRSYFEGLQEKGSILTEKYQESRCMKHFEDSVVLCLDISADNIAAGAAQFLKLTGTCNSLIGHFSSSHDYDLVNTTSTSKLSLHEQIKKGVALFKSMNNDLLEQLKLYYDLEKQSGQRFTIEPLGQKYFKNKLAKRLSYSYRQTELTRDTNCGVTAKRRIDNIIDTGSKDYDTCDKKLVEDIKKDLRVLKGMFSGITLAMPDAGTAVIISCFGMLGFWAPNIVLDCYRVTVQGFAMRWSGAREHITRLKEKISKKEMDYFNRTYSPLPCGLKKMNEIYLSAKLTHFEYKRCIYSNTHSIYTHNP